jgi:hypothetical protein
MLAAASARPLSVHRSRRDGVGGMSGVFRAAASGGNSDGVSAGRLPSPCRGVLANVPVEKPKEERGSKRGDRNVGSERLWLQYDEFIATPGNNNEFITAVPARLI